VQRKKIKSEKTKLLLSSDRNTSSEIIMPDIKNGKLIANVGALFLTGAANGLKKIINKILMT